MVGYYLLLIMFVFDFVVLRFCDLDYGSGLVIFFVLFGFGRLVLVICVLGLFGWIETAGCFIVFAALFVLLF